MRPHVVAQAILWCSPMQPRRPSTGRLQGPTVCRAWVGSYLTAQFILRNGSDEGQHQAEDKIDACGIGKHETRHPRWERCAAPFGAIERTLWFEVFSANAALLSAARFDGVTASYGETASWRNCAHERSARK